MKLGPLTRASFALVVTASAFGLVGCKSMSGHDRSTATVATITELTAEFETGRAQVEATLESLTKISATAATDPRPAFTSYSKNVSALQKTGARAIKRSASLRKQASKHYDAWEAGLAKMTSKTLKETAASRLAAAKERFDELDEALRATGDAYKPFMAELTDLRVALDQDLNPSGIKALSGAMSKVKKMGASLMKKGDVALQEMAAIRKATNPKQVPDTDEG